MQANRKIEAGDAALIEEALEVSIEAARDAAQVIRESAGALEDLEWVEKASADFVTEIDRGAESAITTTIHAAFANAVVVGEELTPEAVFASPVLTFIVDPLDGTTNFLHGFPHFSVSIAVMYRRELAAAVVLNVPRGDLFTATLGNGTRLNGDKVTVSSLDSTSRALIGTGFPFKNPELLETYARQFVEISRHTAGIRRAGSAALDLADVACGRFDGFWELVLAPWDVAAGILLVREAGGIVTNIAGEPAQVEHGAFVAGNTFIHPWLVEAIHKTTRHQ